MITMEINNQIWTRNIKQKYNTVSKYKGVHYDIRPNLKKRWIATGKTKTCYKHLAMFKTENEAALCYNKFIIDNHLEQFFPLNIIEN